MAAAGGLTLEMTGLKELELAFDRVTKKMHEKVKSAMLSGSLLIEASAKGKLKQRSGETKPLRIKPPKTAPTKFAPPFLTIDESAPEDSVHLMNLSGNLRRSIHTEDLSKEETVAFATGTNVFYGVLWEKGITRGGKFYRYPFLGPAFREKKQEAMALAVKKIREAIR